ncbi:MAG: hypothetical protein FWG03_01505 [Clostridiales bacterium]|nr:hypothetical protein [Clostridiales bacterium]
MKGRVIIWVAGVAVIALVALCLTGCFLFFGKDDPEPEPPVGEGPVFDGKVIPGSGGGTTQFRSAEYEFTPDESGIWLIRMTVTLDSFSDLEIIDKVGGFVAKSDGRLGNYNSFIATHLWAGETYTINAVKHTYSAGTPGDYTLTVSLAEAIPGGGGEVRVEEITVYTFVPGRSGEWTFRTSENGDCDPSLVVHDLDSVFIFYDNDGAGDKNALITEHLEAGTLYLVNAYMRPNETGSYTLTVE